MKKAVNKIIKAILTPLLLLMLSGCGVGETYLIDESEDWRKAPAENTLTDGSLLYSDDSTKEIPVIYLTIGRGNSAEGTDHSWSEINSTPLHSLDDDTPYACEALLQFGDDIGPLPGEFGYGERAANATVRLRGENSSRQRQKSYRVDIKRGKGSYNEMTTVTLLKHVSDPLRIKNLLACKLMEEIPGMFTQRCSLVHLYVKDKTEEEDGLFEDYGLYTQVEQINKAYLKNHGLDKDGQLYQAENFDWHPHEDLRPATDPRFDKEKFNAILEIKGSDDHTKLLSLIEAVNDDSVPISETVEKYFDHDNIYNWLAFQLLTGNRTTAYTGYYLYSHQLTEKWYFIPWNSDGIFPDTYERLRDDTEVPDVGTPWNRGIHAYSGNRLFSRMFAEEVCRAKLDKAVKYLMETTFASEKLNQLAQEYAAIAKPLVYSLPDRLYARVTEDDYDLLLASMSDEAEAHYREYKSSLTTPTPFHILSPETTDGKISFTWEESALYGEGSVTYTAELSRTPLFDEILLEESGLSETRIEAPELEPGQYFFRVKAVGQSDPASEQYACEIYYMESGAVSHGILCFYVTENGIEVSEFEPEE